MTTFMMAMIDFLVTFTTDLLMPLMILMFFGGLIMRGIIYLTMKREAWFARAFQKRTYDYLHKYHDKAKYKSFYVVTKMLLEKTYYELFVMRAVMKRRNPDVMLDLADRVFLIQQGCARLVKDSLKQIKYFRYDQHRPKTVEVSTFIFQNNPCFNRAAGIFPIGPCNDFVNILPGIFIVGGIFGTFLGIMKALPELGGMDLADIEKTKATMDLFLVKMAYSMGTSILGIILNVTMTVFNSVFNPGKVFVDVVERYENSLDVLWNSCTDNRLPEEIKDFDEHRDPIEALAEEAVKKELDNPPKILKGDDVDVVKLPDLTPTIPEKKVAEPEKKAS